MLFIRALLLAVAIFCVLAGAATAQSTRFGEMFPNLPDFTAPTNQQLADLAQTQLDPNADSENNCLVTTPPVSAGACSAGSRTSGSSSTTTSPSTCPRPRSRRST